LEADLDFQYLSGAIRDALASKPFFGAGANQRLTAKTVTLYGVGGQRLAMRVDVEDSDPGLLRSKNKTLYLLGTPTIGSVSRILSVPDLTFDYDTPNYVEKIIAWVKHDDLLRYLKDQIAVDLKDSTNAHVAAFNQGLSSYDMGDGWRLAVTLSKEEILPLYVKPAAATIFIRMDGKATITR